MQIFHKIPSRLEMIPDFLAGIIEEIKKLNIAEADLFEIKLALEEALVNAIKHGNKFNPELSVEVKIKADANLLSICVTDQGEGFDFKNIPDPTKSDNLHKLSGRGILLIRSHMDDVEFSDSGRKITMIKLFKKGAKK